MRRALALTVILMTACSTQTGATDGYVLSEWTIDGPDRLAAEGPISLTVENTGEYSHTFLVTADTGEVVGATGVIESGAVSSIELELRPGTYSFSCRIVTQTEDGNLSDHYQRGMYHTVVVSDA